MRKIFGVLAVSWLICTPASGFADATTPAQVGSVTFKKDKLTIETADKKNIAFTVEIADSADQREEGLQHRTSMAEDHGMLFIFDENTYVEMWMKNTSISLDMLFLDDQGKIVYIAAKTKPESLDIISAKREAKGVLELAGGVAAKTGIKVGDRLVYSAFKP